MNKNCAPPPMIKKRNKLLSFFIGAVISCLIPLYFIADFSFLKKYMDFSTPFAPSGKAKPLPYHEASVWDNCYEKPTQMTVKIVLDNNIKEYSPDELCATCIAAAKYYSGENHHAPVKIYIYNTFPEIFFGGFHLASCSYSPRGTGWSYKQDENWTWHDMLVNPEPRSSPGNESRRLYGELDQKSSYDRHKIVDEIVKRTKLDRSVVWEATWNRPKMRKYDHKSLENVPTEGPTVFDAALLRQNNEAVQKKSRVFLQRLEDFWRQPGSSQEKIKQWQNGPGPVFNLEVEKYWGEIKESYPLSHQIMCIPWDIDTLEWHYTHNETAKAEKLLELIKKRLSLNPDAAAGE